MKYMLWLELLTRVAGVVATQKGAAPRELAYLALLTNATTIASMTDADLTTLKAKYEAEVAGVVRTTPEELEEIAQRIAARGERIQGV